MKHAYVEVDRLRTVRVPFVTWVGLGTKVDCVGNIAQIDTSHLNEGSSGLTFVVDRFKGLKHSGHVTLQRGERSRLGDHAAKVL